MEPETWNSKLRSLIERVGRVRHGFGDIKAGADELASSPQADRRALALELIGDWLADEQANVRRAASEGPRIWTSRPYFRTHSGAAIELLGRLRADLVRAALASWPLDDPRVAHTYRLAARFLA